MAGENAEAEARAEAARWLESRNIPGYSAPVSDPNVPNEPPVPPMPPPPGAPPPVQPGKLAPGEFAVGYGTHGDNDPRDPQAGQPFGPPRPPTPVQDRPLDLNGPKAGSNGPVQVIPAGFRPDKRGVEEKEGKAVPEAAKKAYGAAAGLELEAAGLERDANKEMYRHQRDATYATMQANADAAAQHARVQAQRDRMTRDRLAQIEMLNKQAQGDGSDMFVEKQLAARLFGTIMSAIGLATMGITKPKRGSAAEGLGAMATTAPGQVIDGLINADMSARLQQREAAGKAAGRATNLLDLHLNNLRDEDKAIEATRLAYYDNVLQQMEMYKAQNGSAVSDIAYDRLASDILKRRADTENKIAVQEQADIHKSYEEKWQKAQVLGGPSGGTAPGIRQGERVLTVPASDKTAEHEVHVAVPHEVYAKLADSMGATNALVQLDREALKLRAELRDIYANPGKRGWTESTQRVATIRKQLAEKQRQRVDVEQKANEQGVTREADFKHAIEMGVNYSAGVGGGLYEIAHEDNHIQSSMNSLVGIADSRIRGVSGWVVKPAVVTEPAHEGKGAPMVRRPGFSYTGELYRGHPVPPEGGEPE